MDTLEEVAARNDQLAAWCVATWCAALPGGLVHPASLGGTAVGLLLAGHHGLTIHPELRVFYAGEEQHDDAYRWWTIVCDNAKTHTDKGHRPRHATKGTLLEGFPLPCWLLHEMDEAFDHAAPVYLDGPNRAEVLLEPHLTAARFAAALAVLSHHLQLPEARALAFYQQIQTACR